MKKCFKCLQEKPFSEFYKHSKMADGYLNKCKECAKNDVKKHREENLEQVREYDRMRDALPHRVKTHKEYRQTPKGKAATLRVNKASRDRYPERAAAAYEVKVAVRYGRLKPLPCFVCGSKAEAHHPDYSRPLDVVWLCRKHHSEAHAIVREIERQAA